MKDEIRNINEEKGNPQKAYRDEMNDRGSHALESNAENEARDRAKVQKAVEGANQKIDSVHPDDLKNDDDGYALRETEELK